MFNVLLILTVFVRPRVLFKWILLRKMFIFREISRLINIKLLGQNSVHLEQKCTMSTQFSQWIVPIYQNTFRSHSSLWNFRENDTFCSSQENGGKVEMILVIARIYYLATDFTQISGLFAIQYLFPLVWGWLVLILRLKQLIYYNIL